MFIMKPISIVIVFGFLTADFGSASFVSPANSFVGTPYVFHPFL